MSQTFTNELPSAAFRARATSPDIRPLINAYPRGSVHTSNTDIDLAQGNVGQSWNENSATIRVDHRFNDNNSVFARYNIDDGVVVTRSVIQSDTQNDNFRPSNLVLQYQRISSPTLINEFRTGFNRSTLHRFTYGPLPA